MDIMQDVQGVGVYVEFARSNATSQMIFCPDGYDTAGTLYGSSIVRRLITSESPKRPWRFSKLEPPAAGTTLATSDLDTYCSKRMAVPATLLDQIISGDWTMVCEPILVEVSKKDLDEIVAKKAPNKLIYRINQSRTAMGYPEQLIN